MCLYNKSLKLQHKTDCSRLLCFFIYQERLQHMMLAEEIMSVTTNCNTHLLTVSINVCIIIMEALFLF